jgi:hypothetical protein
MPEEEEAKVEDVFIGLYPLIGPIKPRRKSGVLLRVLPVTHLQKWTLINKYRITIYLSLV